MAWMQANLISPHVKDKIRADQIYKSKGVPSSIEEDDEDESSAEYDSIQSEIAMAERRLRLTKSNISKEALQKLNDKIDGLYDRLQRAGEDRDMEEEYLKSEAHLRSISFLKED